MTCCSTIKKVALGTVLAAGGLGLVFGTSAPSYVRTAFHKVRNNAKNAVPVQFEIDRARDEIARLEPAIKENIATLAQAQVEVEHLEREIKTVQANLDTEKKNLTALRSSLDSGEVRLAGNVSYSADEVKVDLARRFDHIKATNQILENKQATLKAKQKSVVAAREMLSKMAAAKKELIAKIDNIEAQLKMMEATKATNEFTFDDSALSRAKESVSDLEKRLEVIAKTSEMEGKYAEGGMPIVIEPKRDILKEIDAEFGPAVKKTSSDKSL